MSNIFKAMLLSIITALIGLTMVGCDEVPLKRIQIIGLPEETIVVGQVFELQVIFHPDNASDQRVEWWTPNNDIILMEQIADEYVSIEPINTGLATVYARSFDGNMTDSVEIKVSAGTMNLRFQGAVNGVVTREYNAKPQQMRVAQLDEDVVYLYREQGQTEYTDVAPTSVGTYDIRAEVNNERFVGSCDGTLVITPQRLQVQANNKEVTYGDSEVALTYRLIGDLFDNPPTIAGTLKREEGDNAGNYRIIEDTPFTLSGETSSNYTIEFLEGNYYIQPAPVTVSVTPISIYYGQTAPAIEYTVSGLKYEDEDSSLNIAVSVPSTARNAGTYSLDCVYDNTNYNVNFVNNRISILPTALTLTVNNASKKYKTEDPSQYTYTIFNSRNTEDTSSLFYEDVLTVNFARETGENAGKYAINAQASGVYASNYYITYRAGEFTITPREIAIKAFDNTKRFGQPDPEYTYEFKAGYDEVLDNEVSVRFERQIGENVGDYTVMPVGVQDANNYTISIESATLTITKAMVSVKVIDETKTYLDEDPQYDFEVLNTGDELYRDNTFVFKYERDVGESVGEYTVRLVIETVDPNYELTPESGKLQIVARHLVYDVSSISMRYYQDYNVDDIVFTLDTELGQEDVEGLDIKSLVDIVVPYQNGLGTYPIVISTKQDNSNYNIEFGKSYLTITQANIVVKFKDTAVYYGDTFEASYEYTQESDVVKDSEGADAIEYTIPSEYLGLIDFGEYNITAQASQPNENYNIKVLVGKLTVNKAEIFARAIDSTTTYGVAPTLNYEITDVKGKIIDGEVNLSVSTDAVDVNTYPLDVVMTQDKENYVLIPTQGTLTINQAKVIYNIDAKTFKYGDEFVFTYFIDESSDAIINNELTITLSGQERGLGEYDIAYNVVEANGKANYLVTVNGAKYEVIKRHYVFKISDSNTKNVGDSDPANYTYSLDLTSDAPLNNDIASIVITFSREEGEEAGQYKVSGTAVDGEYYSVTILDGTLTII